MSFLKKINAIKNSKNCKVLTSQNGKMIKGGNAINGGIGDGGYIRKEIQVIKQ